MRKNVMQIGNAVVKGGKTARRYTKIAEVIIERSITDPAGNKFAGESLKNLTKAISIDLATGAELARRGHIITGICIGVGGVIAVEYTRALVYDHIHKDEESPRMKDRYGSYYESFKQRKR